MNDSRAPGPDRCPRCGAAFQCDAAGPVPCACAGIALGSGLQARLRAGFSRCLCLACLRELAAAEPGPDGAARPSPGA
jgi:hypothetical protein